MICTLIQMPMVDLLVQKFETPGKVVTIVNLCKPEHREIVKKPKMMSNC